MNNESVIGRDVATVPKRSISRMIFGEEALFAPKAQFEITLDEGAELAARSAGQQMELAATNARGLLESVAHTGAERAARYPRSATAWTQLGFAQLATGASDEALRAFTKALSIDQTNRNARLGLARAHNERGDHARAVQLLDALRIERPSDLEIVVALAVAVCDLAGIPAALKVLEVDPPLVPSAAAYYAARGSLWVAEGNFRNAIHDLRQVVRWKPEWAHARNVLGIAELKLGNVHGAELRFREAVRVAPMYLESFLNLLRALMHQAKYGEMLELCGDRYPDTSSAPVLVGRIASQAAMALGEWGQARIWMESALGKVSESKMQAVLLNDLGVAFAHLGRFGEAERRFAASFDVVQTELAIVNRGKALLEARRAVEAVEWLAAAPLPDGASSVERAFTLANALNASRHHNDAAAVLESLVKSGAANAAAYANLVGTLTDNLEDVTGALRVGRAGLREFPENALLVNNLAYALLMGGYVAEAEQVLSSPLEAATERDEVCLTATRGLLAFSKGNVDEGRVLYDRALGLAQSDSLRERVRAKRDLELARALERGEAPIAEVRRFFSKAAEAGDAAYPYQVQAQAALLALRSGGSK